MPSQWSHSADCHSDFCIEPRKGFNINRLEKDTKKWRYKKCFSLPYHNPRRLSGSHLGGVHGSKLRYSDVCNLNLIITKRSFMMDMIANKIYIFHTKKKLTWFNKCIESEGAIIREVQKWYGKSSTGLTKASKNRTDSFLTTP